MFQLTMMGGMNLGFPDVCNTPIPTPAGPVPVPLPYPNISIGCTTNPASTALTVLTDGCPSLNQLSMGLISNGDEPGLYMGIASGMIMGPTEYLLGSLTVIKQGAPAQRMTSLTGHNGLSINCPGVSLVPSQVNVIVLG
jgi:hypothetical protein